jgi:hypothetical protein
MTRKELLELPMCKFSEQGEHRYSSLLIVPTKELHDSGYRLMAIVGLDEHGKPIEIADFCDDIEWKTPILHLGSHIEMGALRTDMYPDIDSIHCWTSHGYFTVCGCSSATITLVLEERKRP